MKTKQTIEVNGTKYDAVSGQVVGTVTPPRVRPLATSRSHQGKTVDGVFRTAASPTHILKTAASPQKITVSRPKSANHTKPHRVQSAQTLMRRAVQRPSFGLKKQLNSQAALQTAQPALAAVVPKPSVTAISPTRQQRASSAQKSRHISHYGTDQASLSVPVTVTPLTVQAPPASPEKIPEPKPHNKPLDIFEQAMQNATHYRPIPDHRAFKRKTRRHLSTLAAGSLALVVMAGFLTYLNTPSLQFRAASLQAGIGASVPNAAASGLSLTGASHRGNTVHAVFSGANGSGSYTLTEQATNWSSDDLIANIGSTDASGTPTYQTVKNGTAVIYRFSNTTATWINNGIWYQLSSPAAISDSQLKTITANV